MVKVTSAKDIKLAFENHRNWISDQLKDLTTLQKSVVNSQLAQSPIIECQIKVWNVFPGLGTPYWFPLSGSDTAIALITGNLVQNYEKRRWSSEPDAVRVIAIIDKDEDQEFFSRIFKSQIISLSGDLVWYDEFEYLVNGGHSCFGETIGSRFTYRMSNAKRVS